MARLTRAESMARTRAALVAAAEAVFVAKGFHAATIEEIAQRAGFTRGAFYANFADKGDVFLAVLDEGNAASLDDLEAHLDVGGTGPAHDPLATMRDWFERSSERVTSLERAFAEFQPVAATRPDYATRMAARLRDVHRRVAAMLEEACAQLGVTLPIASIELARIIVALVDGCGMHRRLDPEAVPATALTDALQYLWAGVFASAT
jgi:AcrR family transcriptional regulator